MLGGGGAGLICAAVASQRGARVLVVDHASEVGRKAQSRSAGLAKADVTVGGIATDGLVQQMMMARRMPGLFCIGEAIDVTGWPGGYDFQWAWASGFAAGEAIAKR